MVLGMPAPFGGVSRSLFTPPCPPPPRPPLPMQACNTLNKKLAYLDSQLGGGGFICGGNELTVADIYLYVGACEKRNATT